jgi:hypothetical protein
MTSAPAAYRKDLAANGLPFGDRDGEWIAMASLAASAAVGDGDDGGAVAWESAIETATRAFGVPELDRLANREWGSAWSGFDALTLAATAIHEVGARALSTVLLDAVLHVRRGTRDLAFGRALAQRARMGFLGGEQEVAEDFYRQVELIGRSVKSVELRARAANGFVGLAQVRGNHPRMLDAATRGLALAERTGIPRLRWNARYSMMMSAAVFRRFDESLAHGWKLFNLVRGDVVGEALALQSLGQLLLDMGETDTARSAFEAVVSRTLPPHVLLSALGSLANASAASPLHTATLEWAVGEVEAFRGAGASPWAYAAALLDCVVALRDAGHGPRARGMLEDPLTMARAQRIHALQYRAEHMPLDVVTARPAPAAVFGEATDIIRSVRRMAPRRLPRHVRMTTTRA